MPRFCCDTRTITVRSLLANVKAGMIVPPNAKAFSTEKFGTKLRLALAASRLRQEYAAWGRSEFRRRLRTAERSENSQPNPRRKTALSLGRPLALPHSEQLSSKPNWMSGDEAHRPPTRTNKPKTLFRTSDYKALATKDTIDVPHDSLRPWGNSWTDGTCPYQTALLKPKSA